MQHGGQDVLVSAEIDCFVDLDPDQKGVHMSRFPELFEEAIDEMVMGEMLLVERLAEHIGAALASLVNLLSPELIVLGGLFIPAGDLLLEPIRRTLQARAFPLLGETPRVELSIFGADAWVIGAAAVALEAFFYSSAPAEGPSDNRRALAHAGSG
jgi:hypothetical protein